MLLKIQCTYLEAEVSHYYIELVGRQKYVQRYIYRRYTLVVHGHWQKTCYHYSFTIAECLTDVNVSFAHMLAMSRSEGHATGRWDGFDGAASIFDIFAVSVSAPQISYH